MELKPIGVDWSQVPCRGPECDRFARGNHGYCTAHVQQFKLGKELTPLRLKRDTSCDHPTCCKPTVRASTFCAAHNRVDWALRKKYGITLSERLVMADNQGHACAICDDTPGVPYDDQLVVDHCHETGKVRGLLCPPCNWMLGHGRDQPSILAAGAAYVTAHRPA